MAVNKNYQSEETKEAEPQTRVMWACPSCGKKAHISRRRCDCGAVLRGAATVVSAKPPDCGPLNFEAPGLSCNDCPEGCPYCSSFGIPETNVDGFGGEECRRRTAGAARCSCCRSQAKAAAELGRVDLTAIISDLRNKGADEAAGNTLYAKAAGIIREAITRPILARIDQAMERAI
jgi:hypothetical protein